MNFRMATLQRLQLRDGFNYDPPLQLPLHFFDLTPSLYCAERDSNVEMPGRDSFRYLGVRDSRVKTRSLFIWSTDDVTIIIVRCNFSNLLTSN